MSPHKEGLRWNTSFSKREKKTAEIGNMCLKRGACSIEHQRGQLKNVNSVAIETSLLMRRLLPSSVTASLNLSSSAIDQVFKCDVNAR